MICSGYIPSFIKNIDLEFLYKVYNWILNGKPNSRVRGPTFRGSLYH